MNWQLPGKPQANSSKANVVAIIGNDHNCQQVDGNKCGKDPTESVQGNELVYCKLMIPTLYFSSNHKL